MRWVSYRREATDRIGVVRDGLIHRLRGTDRLIDLLGDDGETLARAGERALADPAEVVPEHQVRRLAPIPQPPSVRDFYAFEQHVLTAHRARGATLDPVWYEQPAFYFGNPAALLGPDEPVPITPGSHQFDYELEVAAVVGRGGGDLHPDRAEAHVAGYTVLADWTARDLQRREIRVGLGPAKGKDSATSLGPWLVTPDELADRRRDGSHELAMTATVNDRPYSAGNLADLHWSYGQLLAYASRGTRLRPGDVIGSGTVGTGCIAELAGVHGAEAYPWLAAGDVVRLTIERLGTITARIHPAGPVVPLGSARRARPAPT